MFSTLSELFFGSSAVEGPSSLETSQGQDQGVPECSIATETHNTEDDWVIVKNEEESFLLSTEIVTRNRVVDLHEDLSRENFLIEHPLSLSSEEIELRVIKIGRKKRKGMRKVVRNPSRNLSLIPANLRNPHNLHSTNSRTRPLTPISINNKPYQGLQQKSSGDKKRRSNYHYIRHSGANNDRKSGKQRASS